MSDFGPFFMCDILCYMMLISDTSYSPRLFELVQHLHFLRCIFAGVQVRVIGFGKTTVELLEYGRFVLCVGTDGWDGVTTGTPPAVGTAPAFLIPTPRILF